VEPDLPALTGEANLAPLLVLLDLVAAALGELDLERSS
jgi:hypothetical protein